MNLADIYNVGVACTVGIGPARGGRARNEDHYLGGQDGQIRSRLGDQEQVEDALEDTTMVLAVADGMGGHEDGETASTRTVQAISRLYGHARPADVEAGLRDFILETHHRLRPTVAVSGVVIQVTAPSGKPSTVSRTYIPSGRFFSVAKRSDAQPQKK